MTRSSWYQSISVLIIVCILSACASSARYRFPDYAETAKGQTAIPVVIDLFIYRDITGQNRGYNPELNQSYLAEAIAEVDRILVERGFSAHQLKLLNGLTYKIDDGTNYVISKDWLSTKETYSGLVLDQGEDPWLTSTSKAYISTLFEVAKKLNLGKGHDRTYVENKRKEKLVEGEVAPRTLDSFESNPNLFKEVESDVVLLVNIEGRFQKLSKFLAKGLLTGIASSALTGGLAVVPAGSYAITEVLVLNIRTGKILWHNRGYHEGRGSVKGSVKAALDNHPFIDGDTPWDKEQAERKQRQKNNL